MRIYVGGGGTRGIDRVGGQGSQTGFALGGKGGNGTGGGGGGGGGGASAVGTSSLVLAGAAGGGGGGAAGDATQGADQNAGPGGNDGAQNLGSIFSGSGGNGGNSVCSGGGGGGGGGGVGFGAGIGGGGGAGNGSNARRDGYGATRGQSGYRGSGSGATASFISQGNAGNAGISAVNGQEIDGGDGSVEMIAEENTTFFGDGGGGGGSGTFLQFQFDVTDINAGTLVVGNAGTPGSESGSGIIGYQTTESDDPGIGTSITSGLFDSSSPQVNYVQSGTGSGVNGGFSSVDGEKYLRFFGNEATRFARTIQVNASSTNSKGSEMITVRFRVIRGNGSNGGEAPGEPLELFGSNDNATSFIKIGTISSAAGPTNWTFVDIPLPQSMRVSNLILEVRQSRSAAGNANNDNFGIDYVSFIHAEVENTITTYPSGKTDLGIEFITERIEPQGDPINSAGLDVNEGTFTLSSAVKLNVDSALIPDIDIPLLTRYHLVKYMIRAY